MLRKIKNNNKGVDISYVGTAIILVIFVAIASLLDLFTVGYGKQMVIEELKTIENYALCKGFDYETVFDMGQFGNGDNSQEKTQQEFQTAFNKKFNKFSGSKYWIKNVSLSTLDAGGNPISYTPVVGLGSDKTSIYIRAKVTFQPFKFLKTPTSQFFKLNANRQTAISKYSTAYCESTVATTLWLNR